MVDVSVVIPCYNAESFIDECIQSVVDQENVTFEILAVEDRSTDQTWARLQTLAKTIPSLQLHRMECNSGQAKARNVALEKAKGRYVALLDSDDSYRSNDVLARWVAAADRNALDLTISQYSVLKMDGQIDPGIPVPRLSKPAAMAKAAPGIVNAGQSWQILFRREFLDQQQLRFSNRLRQREDRIFFTQAFLRADRIGVINLDAILYRIHPDSTMRRIDYDQLAQMNVHLEILNEAMDEARKSDKLSSDFERANSVSYWNQALNYWGPLLLKALAPEGGAETDAFDSERKIVFKHLSLLQSISENCGPLWHDHYWERSQEGDKEEAVLDVARMAISAKRYDILEMLLERRRIHHSVLRPLVAGSGYDWGEAAVQRYLSFGRGAVYPQENAANAPPLKALVKRVILHVGTTKTGSSALQEFCEQNRFRLLDRGVWYPMSGAWREYGIRRDRTAGHLRLMRELMRGGKDASQASRWLAAEIAALGRPVDTLVLSAENILSHAIWPEAETAFTEAGDPIRRIVAGLGVEAVEVAVVLRRQDAWFASFYREVVANPFNGFTAAPLSFFDDLERRGLFDYERLIGWFEASPVVAQLHLESFGRLRAGGGSIPWFLRLIGQESSGLEKGAGWVSNESFTDAMAGNIRLTKLFSFDRLRAEYMFKQITTAPALVTADFALISHDDWDRIEARLARYLAAFDARFPGEARPLRPAPEGDATPLHVLPALARAEPQVMWTGLPPAIADDPLARPLRELLEDYAYVIRSRSWKLTAPLRRVMTLAKALHTRLRRGAGG